MFLQEAIKKTKTQKKTFVLCSTKIANSSRSDMLQYLCKVLWLNFIFKFYSKCTGFYAELFQDQYFSESKVDFEKLNKVKVQKQISNDFVTI